jgi:hypothetical protein
LDGGCTSERRKKCLAESGPFLERLCETCRYRDQQVSEYVAMLYEMHLLIAAGFSMDSEALSYQKWIDLGILRQAIQARMRGVF